MSLRLRDIQQLIGHHIPGLRLDTEPAGGGSVKVRNKASLLEALRKVAHVPSLREDIHRVLGHRLLTSRGSTLAISEAANLRRDINRIHASCETIGLFLTGILPPVPAHYLGIRLPPDVDSLESLADAAHGLSVAFNEPLRRMGHEPLRVGSAEPGSTWLELVADNIQTLIVVGGILRFVMIFADIQRKALEVAREAARVEQEKQKTSQSELAVQEERERLSQEKQRTLRSELAVREERERLAQEKQKTLQSELAVREERERLRQEKQRTLQQLNAQLDSVNARRRELALAVDALWESAPREFSEKHDRASVPMDVVRAAVKKVADLRLRGAQFSLQSNAEQRVLDAFPSEAISGAQVGEPSEGGPDEQLSRSRPSGGG